MCKCIRSDCDARIADSLAVFGLEPDVWTPLVALFLQANLVVCIADGSVKFCVDETADEYRVASKSGIDLDPQVNCPVLGQRIIYCIRYQLVHEDDVY